MSAMATKPLPVKPSLPEKLSEEPHFFLAGVGWASYLAIGAALADRPGLRMSYDRGNLEFMTTSPRHEIYKKWLGRFIEVLAEEFERPLATGGNMTFQKAELQRGLEGDDCFWIEHEPQMRGKLTWDAEVDPPPDLFLEIEISRNVVDRLDILAAFRVPESWAFNGTTLRALHLQKDGTYQAVEQSHHFPGVLLADIVSFLDTTKDYLTGVREFQNWVRKVLGKIPRQ